MPPYSIDDLIHGTFPSMSDTDRAILLDGALDELREERDEAKYEAHLACEDAKRAVADLENETGEVRRLESDLKEVEEALARRLDADERAARVFTQTVEDIQAAITDAQDSIAAALRRAFDALEHLRAKPSKKR